MRYFAPGRSRQSMVWRAQALPRGGWVARWFGLLWALHAPAGPGLAFTPGRVPRPHKPYLRPLHGASQALDESLSMELRKTVFIEDTDTFGIVFSSNYVKYFLRATEDWGGNPACVHVLDNMRFSAAARLGDELLVRGNVITGDIDQGHSQWRFTVTSGDNPPTMHASADLVLSWAGAALPPAYMPVPAAGAPVPTAGAAIPAFAGDSLPAEFENHDFSAAMTVWGDELGPDGTIKLTSVLNYMERSRTLSLGRRTAGELGLMWFHSQGTAVVVTKINDLRAQYDIAGGEKLEARLRFALRGKRAFTAFQTLWKEDGSLAAHATIELLCMDSKTLKLAPIPQEMREIISGESRGSRAPM